jgi:putative heme iron utilization protein
VVLSSGTAGLTHDLAREAVEHMNGHHQEALQLYATRLLKLPSADWRAAALDSDGIDLSDRKVSRRLAFAEPVATAAELRATLKGLADQARGV